MAVRHVVGADFCWTKVSEGSCLIYLLVVIKIFSTHHVDEVVGVGPGGPKLCGAIAS